MSTVSESVAFRLVRDIAGLTAAERSFAELAIDPELCSPGEEVTRAVAAQVLAILLFDDLLARVPNARAYVDDVVREGRRVVFDHGAVRTVAMAGFKLQPGRIAFARILEPLGYRRVGEYPLPKLGMTGFAYAHEAYPETLPQYFVSELHPEKFSPIFRHALARVLASTRDPLGPIDGAWLGRFAANATVRYEDARLVIKRLASCFTRLHDVPLHSDYQTLLSESPEAAWIATEGNAFNHATDRIAGDLAAFAAAQRAHGRPIKDGIEVSASGRVRQTAMRAAVVQREFVGPHQRTLVREVPGSFYEFISRDRVVGPDGVARLDLAFDPKNATAIFKMTTPLM
jgi:hypothetical protein